LRPDADAYYEPASGATLTESQTIRNAGRRRDGAVLAVDLGTSGCKTALVTLEGEVRAWSFRAVPLYVEGVAAEQEPADWWGAFLESAAEVLSKDPALRSNVLAGTFLTIMSSLAVWVFKNFQNEILAYIRQLVK